jgi:two-component system, NarL family, sensor histidine kinase UhpB
VSGGATILIVDDDRGLLRLMQKALEREGFATATAGSGEEAIAWLSGNEPSLILLDLQLQDMNGQEVVDRASAKGRAVPFMVITGQGDERVAVEMMKRGALDYLVKDAKFLEFVPTHVRRALNQLEKDQRLASAEKQARLAQTVVEQGYSAVLITSKEGADPEITYVNSAFARLAGVEAEKLTGSFSEVEKVIGPFEPMHRVLKTGIAYVGQAQLRSRNGEWRFVDCNITKVLDASGMQSHWAIILRDITEQKQLQREILEISDREQSRIGRDLHDGLGQQLTALEFYATGLKGQAEMQAPKLAPAIEKIGEHLREAIQQARGMAAGLSPVALHRDSLISALQKLADATAEMARVKCGFHPGARLDLPEVGTATQIYRIAQEAVNNALRHGRPKRIQISLRNAANRMELVVKDDGRGFLPEGLKDSGMGLRAMRYRADLIGALLTIESKPGEGTRVCCSVPKKSHTPDDVA